MNVRRLLRAPAGRWIVRLLRPQPAPIPWARAIRAAIAIPVPVGIGMATGQLAIGLLCAMGALSASMADQGGPYRQRTQRITVITVSGAAGFFLGNLVFGDAIATLVLVILAGLLSGIISLFGNNASVAGLQFLIYATIASGIDFGTGPVWTTPLLILAGAVWALLLSLIGGIGRANAPERAAVGDVYRKLAELMRAAGSDEAEGHRQELTASLNAAYDALGSLRMISGGISSVSHRLFV